MTRLSSRLSLALALGAVGLWSVSTAVAATQTVTLKSTKGDQATITLNKQTKKAFKKNHIALKTNKPATRKGNNANFPEKSGKWNFSNTSGNVTYNGVTRFVRGKKSVKLTRLSFTRTVKGKKSTATLTAFFGKKKVTLLTLTGKVKVKMKGAKETVSGFTAKLSKKAASLLNKGLKHKAFRDRLVLPDAHQPRHAGHPPAGPRCPGNARRVGVGSRSGVHPGARERPGLQRAQRHAPRSRGRHCPGRAERRHAAPRRWHHCHRPWHRRRAGGQRGL
jgi:hypothetical protein